jgi:hypothetical protein
MTSIPNRNQLPWLGFVSGSIKAVCVLASNNCPNAFSTSFSYSIPNAVLRGQELLPSAPLVFRNGILQTWMTATVVGMTVTITFDTSTRAISAVIFTSGSATTTNSKTDTSFANWMVGDEIVVEVRFYEK